MAAQSMTASPVVVSGATGWAGVGKAGSLVTITGLEGKQVEDLVLFRAGDPTDRLSVGNTRKMANSICAHRT